MDLTLARDEMMKSTDDPAEALAKVRCFWGTWLTDIAHRLSKGTEQTSAVLADPPCSPPTSRWIRYTNNALSVPTFSLVDPATLSKFQTEGFDHLIVPQNLSLRSRIARARASLAKKVLITILAYEDLYFETPMAVVDLKRKSVVWTGVVSSTRRNAPAMRSSAIENEACDWLSDLFAVLGRKMQEPSSRFRPCQ